MKTLVHYHIFKNAGSSVDFGLKKIFGDKWVAFEGAGPHDILNHDHLKDFLTTNPNIKAVSSHLLRPTYKSNMVLPIIFFRDPIKRAKSVYEFSKRDSNQPDHEITKEVSFEEYVDIAYSGAPEGVVIRDYQVIHITSASFRYPHIYDAKANIGDLKDALELLKMWGVWGVVECYSKSIQKFNEVYRDYLPFPLGTYFKNSSEMSEKDHTGALCKKSLAKLIEMNELDLELYKYALKLYES